MDIFNRVSQGHFWPENSSTVNSTGTSSRVDDVDELPPPPYTVQDKIWDAAEESLPSTLPERPTVIAVMGPTGTGKSTFISKLAGREMNIGHNLSSCTQEVEEVPCKVGDRYVVLVDTPGFNDTERSDTDILTLLADWMKGSYNDLPLSGIIYLHSISEPRMTNSILTNLRMFRKLCGDENLKNVMLATTKWGITPPEDAERRDHELHSESGFWKPMIVAGSLIRRFENSAASAQALIEELLQQGTKVFVPAIQREMVQGKELSETNAGALLNEGLNTLKEQYRKEKDALIEEFKLAKKKKDRETQAMIKKERQNIEKKMAANEEEQRELHMSTEQALRTRLERLEKESRSRKVPNVRRGFWHLSWKCLVCKTKTEDEGKWACPNCGFVQCNEE